MKIGDILTLSTRPADGSTTKHRRMKVVGIYPHFVLLDAGKYRATASWWELEKRAVIRV